MASNESKPVVFDLKTAKALIELVKKNKRIADLTGKDFEPKSVSELFAVKVTKTSGSAGSCSTTCDFTYTVKNLALDTIASSVTPKQKRIDNIEYTVPSADSLGVAYYDGANVVCLYSVAEEVPKVYIKNLTKTVVTGVTCNGDGTITVTDDTIDIDYLSCEA